MLFPLPGAGSLQLAALAGLWGLCIGSFLNVVIYRLPRMLEREWMENAGSTVIDEAPDEPLSLAWPPSHCPKCHGPIRFWENVPLLGFLILGGRCGRCRQAIGWRYPVVEALCGAAFAVLAYGLGGGTSLLFAMAFTAALLALAAIDADTLILPDTVVFPLLWLGLLANLHGRFVPLDEAVLGAAGGYASLWLVSRLYRIVRRRDGMGDGDLKLLAALGAWLGWQMLVPVVLIAAVAAIVAALGAMIAGKRGFADVMPFGTALAAAGWLCFMRVAGLA